MAIIRKVLPGDPDENDIRPHAVYGTDAAESYTTRAGDQLVYMYGGDDRVTVAGLYLSEYDALDVYAGPGNDVMIDRNGRSGDGVHGGLGNDRLTIDAGDGSSAAWGDAGDDVLRSLGGDEGNWLYAGPGNDRVYAGPGRDHLYGGPGVDRFFLNDDGDDTVHLLTGHTGTAADAAKPDTRDVIDNFDPAQDHIDLSAMDASPNVEGDQAFTWIGYAGSGSSQGKPLQMGQVGWLYNHEAGPGDVGVAWVNAGGHQAVVLEDLAAQAGQLDASDFWL